MLTMYDSIDVNQIPMSASYVAGYVGGSWPTYTTLLRDFPHAKVLSIAIAASEDATCLDVEPYDATDSQVVPWLKRQLARGVYRPVIYSSASNMDIVMSEIAAAGIARQSVRFWSAHYSNEHICGPSTCRLVNEACDGTQWTSHAGGNNLDQSVLLDNFFDTTPTTPPPVTTPSVPSWEVNMINALPVLKENDNSVFVKRMQALLNVAKDYKLVVDGSYGPATRMAVDDFQRNHNLSVDGVVGAATWSALVTG